MAAEQNHISLDLIKSVQYRREGTQISLTQYSLIMWHPL